MTAAPGAHIDLATLPNLRDLGGWSAADGGQVATGQIFRSTDLSRLDDPDRDRMRSLGIRTIYDLRTAGERQAKPDLAIGADTEVALDVLADASSALPANLGAVFTDPGLLATVTEALTDGRAIATVTATYREMVTLPSAVASYRRLFRGLLGDDDAPALVHCTAGKDRTGWAAASLLAVLGVAEDDIYREYLLTNDHLIPALGPLFDKFAAIGGDPELLRSVIGVRTDYLAAAFDEVDREHGGVEGYFATALGIDAADQQRLRDRFLSARSVPGASAIGVTAEKR